MTAGWADKDVGLAIAQWRAGILNHEQLLRQLDLALFAWGEPGVVPTEPGLYWVYIQPWGDMNEPWLAVFDGDFWHTMIGGTDPGRWDPTDYNKAAPRFRTCWTPGAP